MGVELVKAATVYGSRLSGNAFKVLVAMSLSSLDKPKNGRPACLYWRGWDTLSNALGYESAERGTSGHNAVARAVRELREAKHITPMTDAGRGTRQSYLVHPGGVNPPAQGEQNAHTKGNQNAHTKGEQNAHVRVSKMLTPRKESGSTGLNQDTSLPVEAQPQGGPDSASSKDDSSPHKFAGTPNADCLACGKGYANRSAHPLHLLRDAVGK